MAIFLLNVSFCLNISASLFDNFLVLELDFLFFELFNIYDYLLELDYSDYAYYVLFSIVTSVFLIAISFSGKAGKLIKDLTVGISAGLVGVDAGLRIWDRCRSGPASTCLRPGIRV